MMLAIFAAIAAFFFVAERIVPARSQAIFRAGFWADVLYVPIHFFMRIAINQTLAVALAEVGRRFLPAYAIGVVSARPLWVRSAP